MVDMKLAVWVLNRGSFGLAKKIRRRFPGADIFAPGKEREANGPGNQDKIFQRILPYDSIKSELRKKFTSYDGHIFIMSAGIVVRLIAELVASKTSDPAVIVVDPQGLNTISLLSGHLGGANELTRHVANAIGSIPVITTATDLKGIIAFDEVARILGARVLNPELIKLTSVSLLEGKKVCLLCPQSIYDTFYSDNPNVFLTFDPSTLRQAQGDARSGQRPSTGSGHCTLRTPLEKLPDLSDEFSALCVFTDKLLHLPPQFRDKTLIVALPTLALGIGCHIGTGKTEIINGIKKVLKDHDRLLESVFALASVEAKKNEKGLLEAAEELGVPLTFYSAKELEKGGMLLSEPSPHAQKHVGARGVAEPAAYLAAGKGSEIIVKKEKLPNMTVAVARRPFVVSKGKAGKIYAVGIGPGDISQMTVRARQVLCEVDTVVGYKTYIELIRPLIAGKNLITTGMTREVDRCRKAIEEARKGRRVAVVSSGDSGIYGMAGLIYELLEGENDVEVEVIPGVTASTAAAAVVGAPLMCDYISLSLSDLLQSTDEVKRRIEAAASSDMVTVLYNPKSKKRTELIELARKEFLKYRHRSTPVAIVTNTYRENQSVEICDLAGFTDRKITMTSLVIIGNSQTEILGGKMITRRGYRVR